MKYLILVHLLVSSFGPNSLFDRKVQTFRCIHAKVSVYVGQTRDFLEFSGRGESEVGVGVPARTSWSPRQFHVMWARWLDKTIDFPSAHAATVFSECWRCDLAVFVVSKSIDDLFMSSIRTAVLTVDFQGSFTAALAQFWRVKWRCNCPLTDF